MGVLSDYRVLDLADEKGMFCARLLAGMGADVIRVDKPGQSSCDTAGRCYLNAGKRSVTLDMEQSAGQDILKRLAEKADVIVETGMPGYLDSLGLGYRVLSGINPGLVMASITGFGQEGPYHDYKSSELVAAALGGWLSVCGEPDIPLKPYGIQAYCTASLFAANGIMLALLQRHKIGRGQYLDVSLMDCVAATLDHALVRYVYQGEVARRTGCRYWNDAFRIFPCRDGYILLSLQQHWETLVAWLDSEGMAGDLTDAKWRDRQARREGIEHIVAVLESWTQRHTAGELVEKGQLMRFPWAKLASVAELLSSPQFEERGYFTDVACPDGRKYRSPGAPVRMSRSPWLAAGRAPQTGEHNPDIYGKELGLSGPEQAVLAGEGVI